MNVYKVIDSTTKQNLYHQDITFWNTSLLEEIIQINFNRYHKTIEVTDDMVNAYNCLNKSRKSNASFVRQIKKILKERDY